MTKPRFDLKAYRESRGWTQSQLAYKLGISRSHIAMMEVGKQGLSTRVIHEIIRKLGVEYEEFYVHEESG